MAKTQPNNGVTPISKGAPSMAYKRSTITAPKNHPVKLGQANPTASFRTAGSSPKVSHKNTTNKF